MQTEHGIFEVGHVGIPHLFTRRHAIHRCKLAAVHRRAVATASDKKVVHVARRVFVAVFSARKALLRRYLPTSREEHRLLTFCGLCPLVLVSQLMNSRVLLLGLLQHTLQHLERLESLKLLDRQVGVLVGFFSARTTHKVLLAHLYIIRSGPQR